MKIDSVQKELFMNAPTLASIKIGDCFRISTISAIYLRVAPVKSLVHSTMVHEVLLRGDCFVVCLDTGMLTIMKANTVVLPTAATVKLES